MTSKLLLFALFVVCMLLMSMNYRKRRKKIVFFGDSITEQGARPGGYIKQLQYLLHDAAVEEDYELVGAGVGGDKIYDLYLRLEEDVLAKGADIIVIFIGVNDVGHKFSILTGTDIKRFEAFYIAIIEKLLSAKIKVVLCTPLLIGENPAFNRPEDKELDLYSDLIRSLATQYDLALVDLRKAATSYNIAHNIENVDAGILTFDKVHLNPKGNALVAAEMWEVLKEIK
ncbi:SGNH/GDSL hydrolase family protein [Segetibacter aerophilus]|nr:GDSL-type esterase/lipase family protein [Segetibacter aerophilus]